VTVGDEPVEVVITAPDEEWMRGFLRALVREHCAAAGHLSPFGTVYRWRGEVYEKTEFRGVLYTRASLVDRIVERTRREHPYEVPHVTATPLLAGNSDYLRWIIEETQPNQS
jgi:periplasmic divalent cation tolerance protein